jgi:hypothetical protein
MWRNKCRKFDGIVLHERQLGGPHNCGQVLQESWWVLASLVIFDQGAMLNAMERHKSLYRSSRTNFYKESIGTIRRNQQGLEGREIEEYHELIVNMFFIMRTFIQVKQMRVNNCFAWRLVYAGSLCLCPFVTVPTIGLLHQVPYV